MLHDAVVIGAGPAGSAAARLLAEAGWQVALVEKAEFPRRKVCGAFISATSVPVLKACGVAARFIAEAGPPVTRLGIYAGNSILAQRRERVWGRALGGDIRVNAGTTSGQQDAPDNEQCSAGPSPVTGHAQPLVRCDLDHRAMC